MPKIGDEAVRDIEHRMGYARETRPQLDPRLRQLEPPDQRGSRVGRERRVSPAQYGEAEERITDCAGDPDLIVRPCAAAADLSPDGDVANGGQRQYRRSAGRDRAAAEEIEPATAR